MVQGGGHAIEPPARDNSLAFASTHKRTGLLRDKLDLQRVDSDGGSTRYTIKPVPDELPFDKGLYVFVRAIQLLTRMNDGVVVVGLAGASGSGKTAFSEKIQSLLPGLAVLSMDMYNDSSKVIDGNFDDPRLTDYELLLQNLQDLRDGKAIQAPIYSFKESSRVGYRTVEVPESRVVMVEGIYALSPRCKPLLDLRVSITGGVHFDLVKRVLRDIDRSAQAPQEILQQVTDTVYPMYKAFIEPDLKSAQIRVVNGFNPFAGFMNPIYILKSDVVPPPEQVQALLQPNHVRKFETETYDIYLLPPGEDPETCQSWLRMRNRDGRYNLMFEEWVTDGPFVISPRVQFEVSVRVLGGLMSLGYEISLIMKRTSEVYSDDRLTIKYDSIDGINRDFVQIQGKHREVVAEAACALGLDGSYIPRSYIELVQLEQLSSSFQQVTEDMKRHFAIDGETLIDEDVVGSLGRSPPAFARINGFQAPGGSGQASAWTPGSAPVAASGHWPSSLAGGSASDNGGVGSTSSPRVAHANGGGGQGGAHGQHGGGPGRISSQGSAAAAAQQFQSTDEGSDVDVGIAGKRGQRGGATGGGAAVGGLGGQGLLVGRQGSTAGKHHHGGQAPGLLSAAMGGGGGGSHGGSGGSGGGGSVGGGPAIAEGAAAGRGGGPSGKPLRWTPSSGGLAQLDTCERLEKVASSISSKVDEMVTRDELAGCAREHQLDGVLAAQQSMQQELRHVSSALADLAGRVGSSGYGGNSGAKPGGSDGDSHGSSSGGWLMGDLSNSQRQALIPLAAAGAGACVGALIGAALMSSRR